MRDQALPTDEPALSAKDVVKRFGSVPVLDRVTLSLERGDIVALVGESGSGKTTLLRLFNRMISADGGEVCVGGRSVNTLNPVQLRRSIGYVQQEGGLIPHWTVLRNAALVPRLRRMASPEELASMALQLVGLPPEKFGNRRPRELSGGQRQRVALARALAAEPEIILLDEPFRALDAITRADLVAAVQGLLREIGVTALLVTHDIRTALDIADRVAVLKGGKFEQIAPVAELRSSPATPYVQQLLHPTGEASARDEPPPLEEEASTT
jgi:osmoprotectant transport system ATP-binding protein